MMLTMQKVLAMQFMHSGNGGGGLGDATHRAEQLVARARERGKLPLPEIKQRLQASLHDITHTNAERLRLKIRVASTAHELWLLRSDIYQCISTEHSQSVAAQRINQLLPSFKHWLPARQLTAI